MPTPDELRRGVAYLAELAAADLRALLGQVTTAAEARVALLDVLPGLVDTYGSAAATLAADWYDEVRIQSGVRGTFTAIAADTLDRGTDELARWGIAPLFAVDADWDSARVLLEGGLQRRIANVSRDTITVSSIRDPQADGWQRVGSGACPFCRMLIARGSVYTAARADFASHDHCHCAAVPAFTGEPRPVKPYTPSSRSISDKDRTRVRAWIATH